MLVFFCMIVVNRGWGVKIWLHCNESLKGEDDGKFDFITDKESAWVSQF